MVRQGDIYFAEETIIKEFVSKIYDLVELWWWCVKNNLENHPLVVARRSAIFQKESARRVQFTDDDLELNFIGIRSVDHTFYRHVQSFDDISSLLAWARRFQLLETLQVQIRLRQLTMEGEQREMEEDNQMLANALDNFQKKNHSGKSTKVKSTKEKGKGVACKLCGFLSRSKRELLVHKRQHRTGTTATHPSTSSACSVPNSPEPSTSSGRYVPVDSGPSTSFGRYVCDDSGPSTSSANIASTEARPTFRCRTCGEVIVNRRELYLHQRLCHQHGEGSSDLRFPWEENGNTAPWMGDEDLERTYKANRNFILGKGEQGSVQKSVNVPIQNVTTENLIEIIQNSSHSVDRTFRLNLSFGFILRNIETGDYRYFIPDRNESVFDRPVLINNMSEIQKKLRLRLNSLSILEYLLRQRPNSKWQVVQITNVKIYFFRTKFLFS